MLTLLTITAVIGIIYGITALIMPKVIDAKSTLKLPYGNGILIVSILLFVTFIVINSTLYKITAQEVGVVITPSGVVHTPITTGWNFVAPWSSVKRMDKTVWVYTLTSKQKEGAKQDDDAIWAPTSDGIKMGFDISVNWRIDPNEAAWVYSNLVSDESIDGRYKWIEENIIRPAIKSVMALTVSNYTPIECYSDKRSEIQTKVQTALSKELKTNRLIVDVVQIREVHYSREYETSINEKKLAEQKVLTLVQVTHQQEELLKQAEINKNISIEKAEGEAKSLQIKGDAINKNPRIIELEWINRWNGALPIYQMGSGQNVMMNMGNLSKNK